MGATAIVSAWVFGMVSGSVTAIGLGSLLTGRMIFNPTRIDWSAGEAKALGTIVAFEGLALGVMAVFAVLEWAANSPAVKTFPLLIGVIGLGGFVAVSFVGRRHNSRGPLKKW